MKLQLALDDITLTAALALVEDVREYIDIIEVGTPFLYEEGLAAVRQLRLRFPDKEILADMKIMDAGEYETRQALMAGADYVTVLGVTDILTVKGCLAVANAFGKTIVVDMICEPDLASRIKQLEAVGVRALAVHTGVDQQAAGIITKARHHIGPPGGVSALTTRHQNARRAPLVTGPEHGLVGQHHVTIGGTAHQPEIARLEKAASLARGQALQRCQLNVASRGIELLSGERANDLFRCASSDRWTHERLLSQQTNGQNQGSAGRCCHTSNGAQLSTSPVGASAAGALGLVVHVVGLAASALRMLASSVTGNPVSVEMAW